ncbi:tubulin epsilon and delta complex protein 2 isoform X1 [Eptesicus fuscus]|uniref:tubulin epsilon and delta complex protein 2 isoform X1 n=1 Tax=Eptesicus fuscus TaxID=29078 RepID=UPI002404685B|nr:tubulin epsilon and delta complex protein 2 isoform X1 [Eptesicus fuscus]
MLPLGCSRRLVAELRDALDTCAERQRQLEQSLRVSRRLLRTWEPAETPTPEPTPGPETNEEAPSPACTPSPQDLKELELLTQALEKAVRVRKGISKAGERDKASSLKSGSIATSATTAAAPHRASQTKLPRGTRQATRPAKGLPKPRLLSARDQTCIGRGPLAAKPGPGLRDQQIPPSAAPQAPEAFTLKEKGTLLQLPMAFRKAASQNSCLWAQLSSTQTSDSMDATISSKTQFLQKMQSGWPSSKLSAAEVEAEVGRLQKACLLLRLRMEEELTRDPTDWMQEYRCLLTLEGLQAIVGQCLHRLQELQAEESGKEVPGCHPMRPHSPALTEVVEQQLGPWPEERLPMASLPCGGGADPIWSPQLLLYSSTQELQTLAALRLRVDMLDQQIHLEKVLMAELLPLVSMQEPLGPPQLALCRAVHSLLCEGGQRFLTILRDEPAD